MTPDLLQAMRDQAAALPGTTGGLRNISNPATGQPLLNVRLAIAADVDNAAKKAAEAQVAWAATPFDQRARIMRNAAELMRQRHEEFVKWTVLESGSIRAKVEWELNASFEQLHFAAGLIAQPNGQLIPSSIPGRVNMWSRVPIGVVGVIAPWNYPVLLAMRSIAPAIALGNSVLLKPDLQTTVSGGLLLAQIFKDAGLPDGVFTVLPGDGTIGHEVVIHPQVRMISFTGSTETGRKIGSICGGLLKKVALELGGNNTFSVLEDADIELAASHGAWGAFLHQGQICMQAGRHLVHRSLAAKYQEALARHAKALSIGNPDVDEVHLGPLINASQLAKVSHIVDQAVTAGAQLLTGGKSEGPYFPPTVISNVKPDMAVFSEEIFGPVAPITTFDSDDELVALINSSPYGLSAGIHTSNIARGIRLARRLATGMVHINDQPINAEFNVPFGGMGASGNGGRFGGSANIEEFTQSQWISYIEQPAAYPF